MNQNRLPFWRWVFAALSIVVLTHTNIVQAHSPGLSHVALELGNKEIVARLTFLYSDLAALVSIDRDADGAINQRELNAAQPHLTAWAKDLLILTMDDQRLGMTTTPTVELQHDSELRFTLRFQSTTGSSLQVMAPLLEQFAQGHRQFISLLEQSGGTFSGMLSATHPSVRVGL
jgi:anti-sigma-K factor RskA